MPLVVEDALQHRAHGGATNRPIRVRSNLTGELKQVVALARIETEGLLDAHRLWGMAGGAQARSARLEQTCR